MIAPTRLVACVVGVAVAACAPAAEPTPEQIEADIAAVRAVRGMEVAAVTSGSADVSFLAADAVWMPPNEPPQNGPSMIQQWITDFMSVGTVSVNYTTSNVTIAGDWAIEQYTGEVTVTPAEGGDMIEETMKGMHVYRRGDDGQWKMVYDIWNTNTPFPES